VCKHTHTETYIYIYICIHTPTHTYAYTHTHTHKHTHTHTHTHTHSTNQDGGMAFLLAHLTTMGIIIATRGVSLTTADTSVTGTLCVRRRNQ
jgi:hypothetical protein